MTIFIPNPFTMEADAIAAADAHGIEPLGQRGNQDARDAFRHAYTSAVYKFFFDQFLPSSTATGAAYAMGTFVEFFGTHNYSPANFFDLNMDLWNDAKGSLLNPTSVENASNLAKQLLDNGDLITNTNPSETRRATTPLDTIQDIGQALRDLKAALDQGLAEADSAYTNALDAVLGALDSALGDPSDPTPFSDFLADAFSAAAAAFNEALNVATPLVLDMDNDGLELSPLSGSNVFFDIDNDQFAERMGWVDADDGFLARDLNSNGNIDNVTELFGADGGTTAWQKLAALDGNADNVLNSSDTAFATLRLWKDANQNGITDSGELQTMAQAGITAINVVPDNTTFTQDGHTISGTVTFNKSGGGTGTVADVFFQNNQLNTWFVGDGSEGSTEADPEALFLPLSRGYGTLPACNSL